MVDTLRELLQDFVLLAAAVDYGTKIINWLKKSYKKHTTPRRRRLK